MRTPAKALLLAAATGLCLAGLASPANAGSYVVSACSPYSTPGAWVQTNTAGSGLTAGNLCGGGEVGPLNGGDGGALYGEDNLNSAAPVADGAQAGWTFTAPSTATITGISYYRALAAYAEPNLVAGLFESGGVPLEECMVGTAFGSSIVCSMPNSQAPTTFSGLSTRSVFFGVVCHALQAGTTGCAGGGNIHYAQADLYSAKVTLSQAALPTLGAPSGALFAGSPVSGSVPVTFEASDPSGIASELVRSESGQTLIVASEACDFTSVQPCPQLPAGSLSVDTTRVADGPHSFSVVVTDAAGNSQDVSSPSVVVDNNGPPAPVGFSAKAAAGGSSNAISLAWANPAGVPAPVTGAMAQLCQALCSAPVSVSASGAAQITAPGPGTFSVRLWLVDAQGRGGAQNAAIASVVVPGGGVGTTTAPGEGSAPPGSTPGVKTIHTVLAAAIKGRRMHVTGTMAAISHAAVNVSWRSRSFGRTLGSGSRVVTIHDHKLVVTFTLSHTARTGAVRVVARSGSRVLAGALARPS
jgi:hypothetical protein